MTEPVSSQDSTLLCATTSRTQLQIGALCRFQGGPLRGEDGRIRIEELRDHVASRLHLMPQFRQRIQHIPFDLTRPVWVDDTDFDLKRHLHDVVLPAPGGPEELRAFMADLLSTPLDPAHPLWDMWLIDGLDDGNVAVVLRVHHVVADGLSLVRAALALLDLEPEPEPQAAPKRWKPNPAPGSFSLVTGNLLARRRHQIELGLSAARHALDPRWALTAARAVVGAVTSPPKTAPRLPLTGRVGTQRDYLWASVPIQPLHDLADSLGVTLNDVVLAAVTHALRKVIGPAGAADLAGQPPKVLVPVGDTAEGDSGNAFSFVVTDLPVHLGDPRQVLDQIHRDMLGRKASSQSTEMLSVFSVIDVVPVPILQRLIPELLARQPFANIAVTNVPGSPEPLYLLGSELLELAPIITGVGNIACIIGVLSYRDQLGIGITVDPEVFADNDALLDALLEGSHELLQISRP